MILNTFIHQQLAADHRRDLPDGAEHTRMVAQADTPSSARALRLALHRRDPRRHAARHPSIANPSTPQTKHQPSCS